MSYTLRFPFKLPPGQEIKEFNGSEKLHVGKFSWSFEWGSQGQHILKVTGLDSEEDCHNYLNDLWSGFNWLLLKKGVALDAILDFDRVKYADDPEEAAKNLQRTMGLRYNGPVHGLVNDGFPSAYPTNKNIRFVGVGSARVVVGTPLPMVINHVIEGMEIRRDNPTLRDKKLQIALDLFSAYWTEHSDNARLLTLVLALESLMDNPLRHEVVTDLLDKWQLEVQKRKSFFADDSEEINALEALERELIFRKTDSLRRQVRSLVYESLSFLKHENPEILAKKAVWIYDQRSKLVHEGVLPNQVLSNATNNARTIVGLVLEARFLGFKTAK